LAVLGVLALAACTSGEADGGVTAPPSPPATSETLTAEPTSEPTETGEAVAPPEMPAEAREQTAEGAAVFAEHYFGVVEYAYASGDTAAIEALSEPECTSCINHISAIEDRSAAGERFAGVDLEILSAVPAPPDERGVVVAMTVREAPSQVLASDGEVVEEREGTGVTALNVYVSRAANEWRVFGVGAVG